MPRVSHWLAATNAQNAFSRVLESVVHRIQLLSHSHSRFADLPLVELNVFAVYGASVHPLLSLT